MAIWPEIKPQYRECLLRIADGASAGDVHIFHLKWRALGRWRLPGNVVQKLGMLLQDFFCLFVFLHLCDDVESICRKLVSVVLVELLSDGHGKFSFLKVNSSAIVRQDGKGKAHHI